MSQRSATPIPKKRRTLHAFRSQVILMYVLVVSLIFGLAGAFTIGILRPYLQNTHTEHQRQTTGALAWEIRTQRSKIQEYSVNILADSKVQSFLKAEEDPETLQSISNELRILMMRYTNFDRFIQGIYLVDGTGGVYGNFLTPSVLSFIQAHLSDLDESSGAALWNSGFDGGIMMYRPIHDTRQDLNRRLGALFISMDPRMFTEAAGRILLPEQHFHLGDDQGLLALGEALPEGMDGPNSAREYLLEDESSNGWTLTTWVPMDVVFGPVSSLLRVLLIGFCISLLLVILLIVLLSDRLTKPISRIQKAVRRFGQGDRKALVPVRRGDEVGELGHDINLMFDRINASIAQTEAFQLRQRQLELKTLQYQINPHFLYNTLDSIQMIARKHEDETLCELVTSLSKLFRMTLSHGQDFVPLRQEIAYVTYYLRIQEIRFPGQFAWQVDCPEALLPRQVLKFLLQPLVENALSHGLRGGLSGGLLRVECAREEDMLVLRVMDDGIGMTEGQLEDLRRSINLPDQEEDPQKGGFGLRNVHQRLLLYYGLGLEIQSEWEVGTTITIQIPFDRTEG